MIGLDLENSRQSGRSLEGIPNQTTIDKFFFYLDKLNWYFLISEIQLDVAYHNGNRESHNQQ